MDLTRVAYSLKEAAIAVGCSDSHLRREVHCGRLPAKRIGRKYVISAEELRAWVDALPEWDDPKFYYGPSR